MKLARSTYNPLVQFFTAGFTECVYWRPERTAPSLQSYRKYALEACRNRATWALIYSILLSVVVLFIMQPMKSLAQPAVLFSKRGLDPTVNPIDRLLHLFGSGCVMFVREQTGRPCRVENELSLFVDTLPHDAHGLSDSLIALGATCNTETKRHARVECVYKKRVQTTTWLPLESSPRFIAYDDFTVRVTTMPNDGVWHPHIEFNRRWEKVK